MIYSHQNPLLIHLITFSPVIEQNRFLRKNANYGLKKNMKIVIS